MSQKRFLPLVWIVVAAVLATWAFFMPYGSGPLPVGYVPSNEALAAFSSCSELRTTLNETRDSTFGFGRGGKLDALQAPVASVPSTGVAAEAGRGGDAGSAGQDYTRTNVQVEGVDEADIVKTDGDFIYLLRSSDLFIFRASPAEELAQLSKVSLTEIYPQDLFLHGDRLAVFGNRVNAWPVPVPLQPEPIVPPIGITPNVSTNGSPLLYPYPSYQPLTVVLVYDVSDRANPRLERTVEIEGSYLSSRKINDMVYFVLQSTPNIYWAEPYPAIQQSDTGVAPESAGGGVSGSSGSGTISDAQLVPGYREALGVIEPTVVPEPLLPCTSVLRPPTFIDNQYLTVVGFALDEPSRELVKTVVLGGGSIVYASAETLYVAGVDYGYDSFPLPLPLGGISAPDVIAPEPVEYKEETVVRAFNLKRDSITHRATGRVPGHVLNQFSMDEHNGAFRIATTKTNYSIAPNEEWREPQSTNAVYVLGQQLERLGAVEGIASGETIYSARFMGERGYLVTFKKIDPFFVLDLADQRNPRILGKLKIPGYSDYLHPYDARHIIGVGKNAEDAPESGFAWYQGMKLALFDVTDPENPRELHKIDIGDRGTDSPALQDHKAFLFDPSRNLLVLPIMLAEIDDAQQGPEFEESFFRASAYGDFVFQGSYIYELTLDKGFVLQGRVTHLDDAFAYFPRTGYYSGESDLFISRNIRIGNNLYSLSNGKVIVNALNDLREISSVRLP